MTAYFRAQINLLIFLAWLVYFFAENWHIMCTFRSTVPAVVCRCDCCWQLELRERQKRQQAEGAAQPKASKKKTYTETYLEEFLPPPEPESVTLFSALFTMLASITVSWSRGNYDFMCLHACLCLFVKLLCDVHGMQW